MTTAVRERQTVANGRTEVESFGRVRGTVANVNGQTTDVYSKRSSLFHNHRFTIVIVSLWAWRNKMLQAIVIFKKPHVLNMTSLKSKLVLIWCFMHDFIEMQTCPNLVLYDSLKCKLVLIWCFMTSFKCKLVQNWSLLTSLKCKLILIWCFMTSLKCKLVLIWCLMWWFRKREQNSSV